MKSIYLLVLIAIVSATGLFAESKKMVLVEEYSSAYCGTCGYFDPTFKSITNANINDVIPISFHTGNVPGDIMYKHNPQVSSRTLAIYGISVLSTPSVWIDGTKVDYTQYGSLTSFTGGMSPVTLKVIETRASDKLNITVGVESDVDLASHRLFVYVVEDNLYYANAGNNGVKDFRWVVRKGFPTETGGQILTAKAGGKQGFNYSVDWHPEWKKENIHIVAFVQSFKPGDNNKVIQAGKTGNFDLNPMISSSETVLDFGDVSDKKELEVNIINDGLSELTIEDIILNKNDKDAYKIKFGSSLKSIPAYGSEKLIIEFFPKENGDYNSELVIVSNAKDKANYKIDLKGKASKIVPFGQISSVSTLSFGDVSTNKTLNLVINNTGTGALLINSIELMDDEDGAYTLDIETLNNITIAIGESLTIPVIFEPKKEGQFYFSDIVVKSNSKNDSELTISLSGRGKDIQTNENLVLSAGGTTLDLGELESGKTTSFKIKNNGKVDIQITDISFSDKEDGSEDSKAFTLISPKNTWVVANMETTIAFRFSPTASKEYNAILNVITAGEEKDLMIDVKATANIASVFGNDLTRQGLLDLNVSPNPVSANSVVEFTNNTQDALNLVLVNSNGEVVQTLYNGLSKSTERISLNSNVLSNGKYFIIATIGDKKEAFSVVITK